MKLHYRSEAMLPVRTAGDRLAYYLPAHGSKMTPATPDLTVRGEPVERVFGNFLDQRYVVNRRYQRKLIWTLSEKQNFIDSIIKGYPVPIILLAENAKRSGNALEIIDGMQRLDAIVSFIENRFAVEGHYFDLNTIAVTKAHLSEPLRSYVAANLKSVRYYDKTVFVFELLGQEQPSLFEDKYFERSGPSVKEILPADFPGFFGRYGAG